MGWKGRAGIIGVAWIVVPWTWAIAAEQLRRRRSDAGTGPDAEDASAA